MDRRASVDGTVFRGSTATSNSSIRPPRQRSADGTSFVAGAAVAVSGTRPSRHRSDGGITVDAGPVPAAVSSRGSVRFASSRSPPPETNRRSVAHRPPSQRPASAAQSTAVELKQSERERAPIEGPRSPPMSHGSRRMCPNCNQIVSEAALRERQHICQYPPPSSVIAAPAADSRVLSQSWRNTSPAVAAVPLRRDRQSRDGTMRSPPLSRNAGRPGDAIRSQKVPRSARSSDPGPTIRSSELGITPLTAVHLTKGENGPKLNRTIDRAGMVCLPSGGIAPETVLQLLGLGQYKEVFGHNLISVRFALPP